MIFPDKKLALRLETSLAYDMREYVQTFHHLFPDVKTAYQEIGGGVAIGMGADYLNVAVGMGLDADVSDADLDTLETFFANHGVSTKVEICPFTDELLIDSLNERGYHLVGFTTAYIHTLEHIPDIETKISVEPIDETEKEIWVQTVMDIQADDETTNTHLAQAVSHREQTTCFLARLDGKPVGASALSIRDGFGTFYFTATRKAYRKQGVQTAMIQARLAYARAQGCEFAFATTIPGNHSMRNIMRAGFQVAYVRCMMQKGNL